jgi:hypothetical protein
MIYAYKRTFPDMRKFSLDYIFSPPSGGSHQPTRLRAGVVSLRRNPFRVQAFIMKADFRGSLHNWTNRCLQSDYRETH